MLLLTACDRTHFKQLNQSSQAVQVEPDYPIDPVLPPPTPPPVVDPPPVVVPQPVQKAGTCADDSSTTLLSCLKCEVPMNPPAPPQFSEKGKSLIDIMAIGCAVPFKNAPKGYVPPTKDELIYRLSRLSPTLYPDSQMTDMQKYVVTGLKNDFVFQQKIFAGLWHHPPYTDAFETYFGVSIAEAIYQFCYQSPEANFTPNDSTPLQSKEYLDCTIEANFNCKEKPEYITGNIYRNQLRNAMKQSIHNPFIPPTPTPSKKCTWESFDGDYDLGGESVLTKWLTSGYKIGIEINSLIGRCDIITALPIGSTKPRGIVKMSGYNCN